MLVLMRGLFADRRRNLDQLAAGRFHRELDMRRLEQRLHQHESLARRLADGEQPVIAHDQRAVVAERFVDARALAEIFGDAFVVVVADAIVETDRRLRDHAQPVL